MSKVIQIRDVPNDVHAAITRAAEERGLSLTSYLRVELAELARRPEVVRHNLDIVRQTQVQVEVVVDRSDILAALDDTRGNA